MQQLQDSSAIINTAIAEHKLKIVGAKYILKTGEVTFFEPAALIVPFSGFPPLIMSLYISAFR